MQRLETKYAVPAAGAVSVAPPPDVVQARSATTAPARSAAHPACRAAGVAVEGAVARAAAAASVRAGVTGICWTRRGS